MLQGPLFSLGLVKEKGDERREGSSSMGGMLSSSFGSLSARLSSGGDARDEERQSRLGGAELESGAASMERVGSAIRDAALDSGSAIWGRALAGLDSPKQLGGSEPPPPPGHPPYLAPTLP